MKFFHTFDIAASGMKAEQFRMDLISQNIANAQTTHTADGTPYRKQMAVVTPEQTQQFESDFAAASFDVDAEFSNKNSGFTGGGVKAQAVASREDFRWVYDPTNPDAVKDKNNPHYGYVAMPNINVIEEMTTMMQATRAYEANATITESAKAMAMKALEIGKG